MAGIPAVQPARDHVRGAVDGRVTLVEYGDFQCPYCGDAYPVVRDLAERFGDSLRFVFRHMPLDDLHPRAHAAALAAEAAAVQGRFWEMHDRLFAHQDRLGREDLVAHAEAVGCDPDRFVTDLDDDELLDRVRRDIASAEASGVRGTPTFFVGETRHRGPFDAESLISALEDLERRRVVR